MSAYHFFLKHAGYCWDPTTETPMQGRIRCAKDLVRAEREGETFGLSFEWRYDDEADLSWLEPGQTVETMEGCICRAPDGRVLASLWGIADASREYRRVVEAELAREALAGVPHA